MRLLSVVTLLTAATADAYTIKAFVSGQWTEGAIVAAPGVPILVEIDGLSDLQASDFRVCGCDATRCGKGRCVPCRQPGDGDFALIDTATFTQTQLGPNASSWSFELVPGNGAAGWGLTLGLAEELLQDRRRALLASGDDDVALRSSSLLTLIVGGGGSGSTSRSGAEANGDAPATSAASAGSGAVAGGTVAGLLVILTVFAFFAYRRRAKRNTRKALSLDDKMQQGEGDSFHEHRRRAESHTNPLLDEPEIVYENTGPQVAHFVGASTSHAGNDTQPNGASSTTDSYFTGLEMQNVTEGSNLAGTMQRKSLVSVANPLWELDGNDNFDDTGTFNASAFSNPDDDDEAQGTMMDVEEVAEWLVITQAEDHAEEVGLDDAVVVEAMQQTEQQLHQLQQQLEGDKMDADDRQLVVDALNRVDRHRDQILTAIQDSATYSSESPSDILSLVNDLVVSTDELIKVENVLSRACETSPDKGLFEKVRNIRANLKTVEGAASNTVMQTVTFSNINEVKEMIQQCKQSLRRVEVETEEAKEERLQQLTESQAYQSHLTGLISNLRKVHRASITRAQSNWQLAGGKIGAMMLFTGHSAQGNGG
mmetsp:Transcript_7783/g.25861  ORF Transcript_7783/g.25861 Transcript_7783/m.25861 type:complete len:595 (+) Transcript_7783:22-1806(+)